MKAIIRYLFPPTRTKSKLPLLPLEWTSNQSPYESEPDNWATFVIKANNLARTDHDARRLLAEYKGQTLDQVVREAKRKRRRKGKLARAWDRLKRIW